MRPLPAFLLLLTAGPVLCQGPAVVISQIYGGGGNSGATLRQDFVELFNRGSAPADLTGWSIQYASAAGSEWQVTPLSGALAPGQYYLIQQSQGAGGSQDLPKPDAAGSIAMSATSAKVALVRATAPLSGAQPDTALLADAVGYGSAASFYRGAPAATLSNTTAAIRREAGCRDTGDNSADFQTGAPNPRNSAAALNPCGAPLPPPVEAAIHDVQGPAGRSPLAGSRVAVTGLVTARKSNGFFLQAPDSEADADPETSEGVFVFTSSAPADAAAPGARLRVVGTVAEYRPASDPHSPTLTEITDPEIAFVSGPHPLPAPVTLGTGQVKAAGSLEQLERFEGMRVHVPALRAVGPSDSRGVFFAVLPEAARPFREPGIALPDPLPESAPPDVPRFDGNPERLRIESRGQPGAKLLQVTSGAAVSAITGPLDYAYRTWSIAPDPAPEPNLDALASWQPVPQPAPGEFTIATWNLRRLLEPDEARLAKASLVIRSVLRLPDILGVQEVGTLATLAALAGRINADARAAGLPDPAYRAFLEEGNDPGGIDSGFLIKTSRVEVHEVSQHGKDRSENDRPPLVARLSAEGLPLTVIVNHLRSLEDVQDPAVSRKRLAQARFLADLIQLRQAASENLLVLGDFNSFPFNDGWVDVMGIVSGRPAAPGEVVFHSGSPVDPPLANLLAHVEPAQAYSYVYDGNAQALDHILVSPSLQARLTRFLFARSNADFPDSLSSDPARPERASDHDAAIAYLNARAPE